MLHLFSATGQQLVHTLTCIRKNHDTFKNIRNTHTFHVNLQQQNLFNPTLNSKYVRGLEF